MTLADACQRILSVSETFFIILSFNTHPVEFACWILRGKNQERRHVAGRSIQDAAERSPRKWLVQDGCGILRHAVGIVSDNARHVTFLKNLALFLQILGKKKSRALLNPLEALV